MKPSSLTGFRLHQWLIDNRILGHWCKYENKFIYVICIELGSIICFEEEDDRLVKKHFNFQELDKIKTLNLDSADEAKILLILGNKYNVDEYVKNHGYRSR